MAPIIINLAPDGIDWSAWLQAGGAVAGIFLAVLLPYWQRHSERREFLTSVAELAWQAHNKIRLAAIELGDEGTYSEYLSRIELEKTQSKHVSESLKRIPLHELGRPELIASLLEVIGLFDGFFDKLTVIQNTAPLKSFTDLFEAEVEELRIMLHLISRPLETLIFHRALEV